MRESFERWARQQGLALHKHSNGEYVWNDTRGAWAAWQHVSGVPEVPSRDDLMKLLDEVRQCFTRDDDLPGDLLPRIDAAIDGVEDKAK